MLRHRRRDQAQFTIMPGRGLGMTLAAARAALDVAALVAVVAETAVGVAVFEGGVELVWALGEGDGCEVEVGGEGGGDDDDEREEGESEEEGGGDGMHCCFGLDWNGRVRVGGGRGDGDVTLVVGDV